MNVIIQKKKKKKKKIFGIIFAIQKQWGGGFPSFPFFGNIFFPEERKYRQADEIRYIDLNLLAMTVKKKKKK